MVDCRKAIFFDRDGVLINAPLDKDNKPLSINKLSEVQLCKGIEDVCNKYKNSFLLIMITNQPDFKRKKNTKKNIMEVNNYLKKKLKLKDIFVCYESDDSCFFRKPNPGMLLEAKKKYNIDMDKSYFIGDRWRDIDAGKSISCKTIFIDRKYNEKLNFKPDFKVTSLKEVMEII